MAHIGQDEFFLIWLPEPVSEELLSTMSLEVLNQGGGAPAPEDPTLGFISRGWFGPFLLGPQSRLLRGRC